MIELRWVGRSLQYRQREFQVDAAGAFCGLTDFGEWQAVENRREMPPFIKSAREVVSQFKQHGLGPEFPELQAAIENMQEVFERSIWNQIYET